MRILAPRQMSSCTMVHAPTFPPGLLNCFCQVMQSSAWNHLLPSHQDQPANGPPHFTAYSSTKCEGANLFSLHISDLQRDLTVNITSLYAAGAEAVEGFSKLPDHISKTFIFVGKQTEQPLCRSDARESRHGEMCRCVSDGECGEGVRGASV